MSLNKRITVGGMLDHLNNQASNIDKEIKETSLDIGTRVADGLPVDIELVRMDGLRKDAAVITDRINNLIDTAQSVQAMRTPTDS